MSTTAYADGSGRCTITAIVQPYADAGGRCTIITPVTAYADAGGRCTPTITQTVAYANTGGRCVVPPGIGAPPLAFTRAVGDSAAPTYTEIP